MKHFITAVVAALTLFLVVNGCQAPQGSAEASLDSRIDSLSYSIGYLTGQNLAAQGIDSIDRNNFNAGLEQALNDSASLINQMGMQTLLQRFQQEIRQQQMAEQQAAASENVQAGQEFLDQNAENEDVVETESGLQYRVIEEGTGVSPTAEDTVTVHYVGTLTDGTVFDTSRKDVAQENDLYSPQREPYQGTTFPLNGVIPGWTEGVQLMSEGATYEFFIPANLAYGNNPPPGSPIQPGSVLIFEVELLEVN